MSKLLTMSVNKGGQAASGREPLVPFHPPVVAF